jgi:spore coat protein H
MFSFLKILIQTSYTICLKPKTAGEGSELHMTATKSRQSISLLGVAAAIIAVTAACESSKNQDTDGGDIIDSNVDGGVDGGTDTEEEDGDKEDGDKEDGDKEDGDKEDGDSVVDFYALDHVVEVNIEMAPDDWDLLRYEGRGTASVVAYCQDEYEYTYFDAEVTIDGEPVDNVQIRKKGFFGSLSVIRPSMKLKFDAPSDNQMLSEIKRMTLNNDRQDPSHTHQAMSYALFSQAGIAAPRCNFARVTVNGEDLGIYSNVEPIKKSFLARHFESNDGNLYEAQGADFSPELVTIFQRKNNIDDVLEDSSINMSDLTTVVDALEAEDAELVKTLETVVNLDGFITFWAMEVILGHWDSYSGNRNNYYIYHDPSSGLFNFIPWGTDGAFETVNFNFPEAPASVYAMGALANRLYNLPETREMYQARLDTLLTDLWDETALLAELDRIDQLTSADSAAIQNQKSFIEDRKQLILDDIAGGETDWPYPYKAGARVCGAMTDISGDFSAVLGSGQDFVAVEDLTLTIGWDEGPEVLTDISTAATIGVLFGMGAGDSVQLTIMATRENGDSLTLMFSVPLPVYAVGEAPFHGLETTGMLFEPGGGFSDAAFIGDGAITFDEAGNEVGETVSGSFVGKFAKLVRQ